MIPLTFLRQLLILEIFYVYDNVYRQLIVLSMNICNHLTLLTMNVFNHF